MSEEMIIYEESIFTSSGLGRTGFNKSNKKQENFNFTPSPTRDFLYEEIQSGLFHEIDTYENTPLDCIYSRSLKENIRNKSVDNPGSDLITDFYNDASEKIQTINSNNFIDCYNKKRNVYKKKNSISSIDNNQDIYSVSNKKNLKNENTPNFNKTFKKTVTFENNLFNTPQMGRQVKKSTEINHKRKNSSQIVHNYKDIIFEAPNNNNSINNQNNKIKNYQIQSTNKFLFSENLAEIKKTKSSNKNLNKIEFNSKNVVVDLNKERELINDSIKIQKKNTTALPTFKKEFNFNIKDEQPKSNKNRNSLNVMRKKSFKEDPGFNYDGVFNIKLSNKFNSFKEYEQLNTSQINNCNFYEHTEDCFKIISKLDKKLTLESHKLLQKIKIERSLEIKLNTSNYKLALFDLNETLINYSLDNVDDFDHKLSFEITLKDNEKINHTVGVNVRPFLTECLKELSKSYIIGLFTSTERELAERLIEFIDPEDQFFQIKLFRENCVVISNPIYETLQNLNQNGNSSKGKEDFVLKINNNIINLNNNISPLLKEFVYLKDLRVLENVPLEKTIIVDNSVLSFCLQMENGIPIFPFYKDKTDSELRVLLNYLNHLILVKDVRIENKNVIKLDSLYKMVPLLQEYSSTSSIDTNGHELFYDSENANNLSNIYLNKKKSSSKNVIAINTADNFDYSLLSNPNNTSKINNNNICNMTHVTFNGNFNNNLNNSLNSLGNEIKIGSPISRAKEMMKHNDTSFQVLFVKSTEEDLNENTNSNKTLIINTLSYDSSSSQSKTNSFINNNNNIYNSENNKDRKENGNLNSNTSTVCESNNNASSKKDFMDSNVLYCCNQINNINLNIFNSTNSNGSINNNNNNFSDLKAGNLKISNFEIVNINNINCFNSESKDFSSQSPTNNGYKSNFDTNFSFGGSGKKGYCSNKSFVSNRSNISNKSILQEKLFVCLEEFHSKYTNFFKYNQVKSQNHNNYE